MHQNSHTTCLGVEEEPSIFIDYSNGEGNNILEQSQEVLANKKFTTNSVDYPESPENKKWKAKDNGSCSCVPSGDYSVGSENTCTDTSAYNLEDKTDIVSILENKIKNPQDPSRDALQCAKETHCCRNSIRDNPCNIDVPHIEAKLNLEYSNGLESEVSSSSIMNSSLTTNKNIRKAHDTSNLLADLQDISHERSDEKCNRSEPQKICVDNMIETYLENEVIIVNPAAIRDTNAPNLTINRPTDGHNFECSNCGVCNSKENVKRENLSTAQRASTSTLCNKEADIMHPSPIKVYNKDPLVELDLLTRYWQEKFNIHFTDITDYIHKLCKIEENLQILTNEMSKLGDKVGVHRKVHEKIIHENNKNNYSFEEVMRCLTDFRNSRKDEIFLNSEEIHFNSIEEQIMSTLKKWKQENYQSGILYDEAKCRAVIIASDRSDVRHKMENLQHEVQRLLPKNDPLCVRNTSPSYIYDKLPEILDNCLSKITDLKSESTSTLAYHEKQVGKLEASITSDSHLYNKNKNIECELRKMLHNQEEIIQNTADKLLRRMLKIPFKADHPLTISRLRRYAPQNSADNASQETAGADSFSEEQRKTTESHMRDGNSNKSDDSAVQPFQHTTASAALSSLASSCWSTCYDYFSSSK